MDEPSRILLIRPSALGDVCRTVPLLVSLRRAYPEARIDWLVQDGFGDAIRHHPDLSGLIPFARAELGRSMKRANPLATLRFLNKLRSRKYDLVIDAQGLFRSGLFARATRARRRVGHADARERAPRFYTDRVACDAPHTVDRMLALLGPLGVEAVADMRLYTSEDDRAWADVQCEGRAPIVIACYDYRQTSIGPYGEVAIVWPVVRAKRRPPPLLPLLLESRWPKLGWWVRHLPVTERIALDAGRTLWGYPKFLADIEFRWQDSVRTCALEVDGSRILRLEVDTRMPARPQRFTATSYTVLGDELLTTRIDVDAVGLKQSRRGRADLSLGPHPIGRELAELGMQLGRPVDVRWFPIWRATLPAACRRDKLPRESVSSHADVSPAG